jgi:periplasmic divalent cation tolerance protein
MVLVYTTIGSREEGKELLHTLLKEHTIACGSLIPIESMYYWEQELKEEKEYGILMKTQAENKEKVMIRIAELHPYEIPLISTWLAEVNAPYYEWMKHSSLSHI